jgi:hypothetical protein
LGGTTSNSEPEDTQAAAPRRSASKPSVKDHIQSMGWKQPFGAVRARSPYHSTRVHAGQMRETVSEAVRDVTCLQHVSALRRNAMAFL